MENKRSNKEREQLKRELLEYMCECAERINVSGQLGIGLILDKEMPSFKPGVSDKMIFMEIIEANMPIARDQNISPLHFVLSNIA